MEQHPSMARPVLYVSSLFAAVLSIAVIAYMTPYPCCFRSVIAQDAFFTLIMLLSIPTLVFFSFMMTDEIITARSPTHLIDFIVDTALMVPISLQAAVKHFTEGRMRPKLVDESLLRGTYSEVFECGRLRDAMVIFYLLTYFSIGPTYLFLTAFEFAIDIHHDVRIAFFVGMVNMSTIVLLHVVVSRSLRLHFDEQTRWNDWSLIYPGTRFACFAATCLLALLSDIPQVEEMERTTALIISAYILAMCVATAIPAFIYYNDPEEAKEPICFKNPFAYVVFSIPPSAPRLPVSQNIKSRK